MAFQVGDRVKETTTTTGTGDLSLGGAAKGFRAFSDELSDQDTCLYVIVDNSNGDYEVGEGTYTASGDTLSRDTVRESSNAGSKVDLSSGQKLVGLTAAAGRTPVLDADPSSGDLISYDGTQFKNIAAGTGISGGGATDLSLDESVLKDGGAKELDVADLAGGLGSTDTLPISDGSAVSWGTAPNAALTNDSVTVAGNSVALGSSTSVAAEDLSNVDVSTPSAGQLLIYHGTNSQFETVSVTDGTGVSKTEADASLTLSLDESVLKDGGAKELDVADLAGGLGSSDNVPLSDGSAVSWGTVPNAGLTNDSVTVAGNSVSLGGSTAVSVDDLSDVASSTESAGEVPIWHGTNSQYENATLTGGDGISVTNADASITVDTVPSDITGSGLTTSGSPANIDVGSGTGITVNASDVELNETVLTDGGAKELDLDQFAGGNGTSGQVVTTDGAAVSWGTVGSAGIGSNAITNTELDNSSAFTFNADMTLGMVGDTYKLAQGSRSSEIQFSNETSGADVEFGLNTKDGDGTDSIALRLFAVGQNVDSTDLESLRLQYNSASTPVWYEVATRANGTGSHRAIHIYSGGNSSQIVARTDGNVAMANNLKVGGTGAASGGTVEIVGDLNINPSNTFSPSNDSTDRTFDANSTSTSELADVLATLIRDLGMTT